MPHPGAVDAAELQICYPWRKTRGRVTEAGSLCRRVDMPIRVNIGIRGPSSSRRQHRLIVAALFAGLAVSTVRADTFRCGTGLVRPGDTSFEVLKKCGRPTSQQQISGANERFVEQWYYEPRPTEFTRILTFVGTRLVNIETVTRP
jgi:hypothetical protein